MLRRGYLSTFLAALLACFPAHAAPGSRLSPSEALTDRLLKELSGIKTLVVFDLTGPDGQSLPLGSWIADRISNNIPDGPVRVVARDRLATELHKQHLTPQEVVNATVESNISRSLEADGFISGSFGPFKDQIGITLAVWRASDKPNMNFRFVSMVNGKMSLDSEAASHITIPLESMKPSDGVYKAGYAGMTVAVCESCPPPQFPPAAVWRVKQGKIVTMIVVSPVGRVTDVKITES